MCPYRDEDESYFPVRRLATTQFSFSGVQERQRADSGKVWIGGKYQKQRIVQSLFRVVRRDDRIANTLQSTPRLTGELRMSEALVSMIIYAVDPSEQSRLQLLDSQVIELLLQAGISNRAVWQGGTSGATRRLKLVIAPNQCLFDAASSELLALPDEMILQQIAQSLSEQVA
jgi:hypothetical protein